MAQFEPFTLEPNTSPETNFFDLVIVIIVLFRKVI